MKVVLITVVFQCTIYFNVESIIFRSYNHRCLKVEITVKRKRSKIQSFKYQSSQWIFDNIEGVDTTLYSRRSFNH